MRFTLPLLLVCSCSGSAPTTRPPEIGAPEARLPEIGAPATRLPEIGVPLRTGRVAGQDAAVIVSVETYHTSIGSNVPYAHRDGDAVESHLRYTRGVPSDRITRLKGATCKKLSAEVQKAATLVGAAGTLWIYFSGHGSRSELGHLLVCDDARGDEFFFDNTMPVTRLQKTADGSQAKRAIIMIDACFGATGRDGNTKSDTRFGAAAGWVSGSKTVVWSATEAGEQARPLHAAKYGVFTYLAVGALRGWADGEVTGERDGAVTLDEAQAYMKRGLRDVQVAGQTPKTTGPEDHSGWTLAEGVKEFPPTLEARPPQTPPTPQSPETPTPQPEPPDKVTAALNRARCLDDAAKRLKEKAATQLTEALDYFKRLPEGRAVLTAWLEAYQNARVKCGPAERAVMVADVAVVTRALGADATTFRPRLVALMGGPYLMGSPKDEEGRHNGETQHRVEVSGFEMMATEVTQEQYAAVMGSNPSHFKACKDCPVEQVSWLDAVKYANALSEKEGLSTCYAIEGEAVTWKESCAGYRLPTEAEWEYAARAGTTGARYGALDTLAWYDGNSNETHPVAKKQPNAWGLYDMLGNVYEWCWDWYAPYPKGSQSPPRGPEGGLDRVARGGSWDSDARWVRAASRDWRQPGWRNLDQGFRLVRRP